MEIFSEETFYNMIYCTEITEIQNNDKHLDGVIFCSDLQKGYLEIEKFTEFQTKKHTWSLKLWCFSPQSSNLIITNK